MKGISSKAPSGVLLDPPTQGPRGILEIRWITRNLYDHSKAYFAVTFLSSSSTCPRCDQTRQSRADDGTGNGSSLKNGTAIRRGVAYALTRQQFRLERAGSRNADTGLAPASGA